MHAQMEIYQPPHSSHRLVLQQQQPNPKHKKRAEKNSFRLGCTFLFAITQRKRLIANQVSIYTIHQIPA